MSEVIDRFWKAFLLDPARRRIPRTQEVPPEMLEDEVLDPPWCRWRLMNGRTSRAAVKEWEESLGWRLPGVFWDWFLSKQTLQVDCGILRLACAPPATPFSDLEELLEWDLPLIRTKQLFPIGDEGLRNAGPVCLDLRAKAEAPVVYWDGWDEAVSEPIFSSFERLLEGAAFAMENPDVLRNATLLDGFLALDPEGAGRTGEEYWRSVAGG
jgi:hypothetical protein